MEFNLLVDSILKKINVQESRVAPYDNRFNGKKRDAAQGSMATTMNDQSTKGNIHNTAVLIPLPRRRKKKTKA